MHLTNKTLLNILVSETVRKKSYEHKLNVTQLMSSLSNTAFEKILG